ncbi:DUF1189 domain-containing protein [Bacillus sp. 03113]|uniref:DUF1189 domain-containing protein n=1 Tax=Bacillus sp. 03113 TaxID=2578211 RepID=UPI001143ABA9|nr:DUF1189 domain-containing protein [Bacillus sp. 03113]
MNIGKQLFKSLYSPKDIASYRFQGIGKTILFVFFLTLISVIPTIYHFSTGLIDGLNQVNESIKKDIPSFSIENGELISDQSDPVTINKNDFTIIFDGSGKVDENQVSDTNNGIALLKDEFIFFANGQSQSYSYSMLQDLSLTKDDLVDFLGDVQSMLGIIIPIVAFILYLFASAGKFIEICVLAIFGLFFANMLNRPLKYGHSWRISAYAVTLPTIFFTVMEALKTSVSNGFLLNWCIAFILIFLSLKEIPSKKQKETGL